METRPASTSTRKLAWPWGMVRRTPMPSGCSARADRDGPEDGGPTAGHGIRAVLADLFPQAPLARSGVARWVVPLVQVAVVALGAAVLLARVSGRPAWQSVYAEDPGIYLPAALAHPWHLLASYGGYLQLVPRLIGQVAALVPVRD